jgi:hypothetical protein
MIKMEGCVTKELIMSSDTQHYDTLITIKSRRLYYLQCTAAHFGQDTPIHIQMEIADLQQEIYGVPDKYKKNSRF